MGKLFLIPIIASVLIIGTIPAFADTKTVIIPSGTSVPGCESTNACFIPSSVTVNKFDSVKWVNKDSAAHTVTSGQEDWGPDGNFDSSLFMSSFDFSVRFTEEGYYPYFCMVHPWMVGDVTVTSADSTPDPTPVPVPYTPPPSSGTDWESKYFDALSKFNDASAKVGQLERENDALEDKISELEVTIEKLNTLVMEQLKVIYDWVVNR